MKKFYPSSAMGKVAFFLAAAIGSNLSGNAQQVFTPQTGAQNPLNGIDVGDYAAPFFTDVDGDGKVDLLAGNQEGTIVYYRNTGTAAAPVFTLQAGAANPFAAIDVSDFSAPSYVDIDGDGDKDLLSGEIFGSIKYYRNTGTAAAPVFVEQIGAANPFNTLNTGNFSKPSFGDIDGDGDLDAIVGEINGTTTFYRNTGTATAPVFTAQPALFNNVSGFASPVFADVNGDGDLDVVIGGGNGVISYFENTGSATAPVYVQRGGTDNPFGTFTGVSFPSPTFTDLTGDGLIDFVVGAQNGTFGSYQNTSTLPLKLLSFSGTSQGSVNQLSWKTSGEVNTKSFEVEAGKDGVNFSKIATVAASGSGNNSYSAKDAAASAARVYYRLKMIDVDGKFTYSQVIWISGDAKTTVSIYPNPVGNVMNLNIGSAKLLKTRAEIFDATGRLQQNVMIETQQQQVPVQALRPGMYIIKFANGTSQSFNKN